MAKKKNHSVDVAMRAHLIEEHRKSLAMTREEYAKYIGITQGHLSMVLNEPMCLTDKVLERFVNAGIDENQLRSFQEIPVMTFLMSSPIARLVADYASKMQISEQSAVNVLLTKGYSVEISQ